ncbi:UNVERIFIED_CONTAM: hypothetical protein Sangu_2607900 [Sesamum angustifolium]|uniref:RNase H type-1 domain-containing protein n=1 Tax=Sesamum angustifolium TaxID=2727405 RepID=A0AAW2J7U7_9LAMI
MTCRYPSEDSKHVFYDYPFARQTWALANLPSAVWNSWPGGLEEWLLLIRQGLDHDEFNMFVVVCWMMWKHRNALVMENKSSTPLEVVNSARSFLMDFQKCIVRTTHPGQPSEMAWSPPKQGLIKINFDASISKNLGGVGIGVVARDHERRILDWRTATVLGITAPEHDEAITARTAVEFANQMDWRSCVIEGDCLQAIQKIRATKEDSSSTGAIISDIHVFTTDFVSVLYSHVKRSTNRAAHCLAQVAFSLQEEGVLPSQFVIFLGWIPI